MALEAINEVKKSEEKAEQLIQEANKQAKDIILKAKEKANKEYQETLNKAQEKANELIKKALDEGEEKSKPILKDGEKDIADIGNMSNDVKKKAINLVIERIVKSNGNS